MKSNDVLSLDYFVAGVPPGPLFKMSLDDLKEMVDLSKEDLSGLNPVVEVCLIGLVSHFEAFCKNMFAAVINICPQILNNFCAKRPDIAIKVKDLLALDAYSKNKLGFLLSEKYDFGSAKDINSLYMDLLSITPFSKNEMEKYARLLNDRNLLVHHAGIYTMRYHEQAFKKQSVKNRVFFDSLVVRKKDFSDWAKFIENIVVKIINSSHSALSEFIKNKKLKLPKENKKALEFLKWY